MRADSSGRRVRLDLPVSAIFGAFGSRRLSHALVSSSGADGSMICPFNQPDRAGPLLRAARIDRLSSPASPFSTAMPAGRDQSAGHAGCGGARDVRFPALVDGRTRAVRRGARHGDHHARRIRLFDGGRCRSARSISPRRKGTRARRHIGTFSSEPADAHRRRRVPGRASASWFDVPQRPAGRLACRRVDGPLSALSRDERASRLARGRLLSLDGARAAWDRRHRLAAHRLSRRGGGRGSCASCRRRTPGGDPLAQREDVGARGPDGCRFGSPRPTATSRCRGWTATSSARAAA
jgi:hypothetical protein